MPRTRLTHMSLAGQYLVVQLLIIAVVIVGVVVVSWTQATQNFERVDGRRTLSAAESLASSPLLKSELPGAQPKMGAALPSLAERTRAISDLGTVSISNPDGLVIASTSPDETGTVMRLADSDVAEGRSWLGGARHDGVRLLAAQVPVLGEDGTLIGIATASQPYPNMGQVVREIAPSALVTLLVCLLLGGLGSYLLSQRIKRQTRGMEPREIAELFEYREALLHGVKEGIIAVGPDRRVTLVNEVAKTMLELPDDCVGRTLEEANMAPQVVRALMKEQKKSDRRFLLGERVLVSNRRRVESAGQDLGSVTTLRDRTELSHLEQELGDSKATSELLRAQTHEFANHLHTISGLIQLGEYDDVMTFIDGVSLSRSKVYEDITLAIADPTIAALLIAKSSLAAERGIALMVTSDSELDRCGDHLARDLTTVLGNLIDNAFDAVVGHAQPTVEVAVLESETEVTIIVTDNGSGIDDAAMKEIFKQGFSTKSTTVSGGRGFGLALTRMVARKRGGDVEATNVGGARFTARLRK